MFRLLPISYGSTRGRRRQERSLARARASTCAFYLFISRLRQPLREVPRGFEHRGPDGNRRRRDIAYCLLEPLRRRAARGFLLLLLATERKSHGATPRRKTHSSRRTRFFSFLLRKATHARHAASVPAASEGERALHVEIIYPLSRRQLVDGIFPRE